MDTGLYIGPDGAPDRYRLLRSIGRGGEAVLYLAEIELGGGTEPVVVKVLDSKTTLSQEQFDRISSKWREQAELLRFVNRLGVVGIREHFEGPSAHRTGEAAPEAAGRALYLVMNHVEGLDLRDWRAERALDTPAERREAVRCLEQLADVLDWLHTGSATPSGRSVVHGDLSPGNVMIDANGQATLVDFGLSKLTADHQTAEVWFTPGFAAPEVFEGKRSAATDRYAFGALAYFLLSGESPATMPEQVRAALLALPELAGLEPERAARIAAVFATDPANRPESLSAWVRELRPAVISTTRTPRTSGPKDAVPVADAAPPPPGQAPAVPPLPDRPAPVPVPVHAPPVHTPPPSYIPAPPEGDPVTDTRPTVVLGAQAPTPTQVPEQVQPPVAAFHQQPPPQGPGPGPGPATAATPLPPKRGKKGPLILAAVLAVVLMASGALVAVKFMGDDKKDDAADPKTSTSAQQQISSPPTTTADPTSASPSDEASSPEPSGSDSGSGKPTSITEGDNVSLTAMNWVDASGNDAFDEIPATVNTKEYTDAKVTTACETGFEEFNLNRAWTTFTVDAGLLDTSKNAAVGLTITADGKRLALKKLVLGTTEKITVDVKGALRLRIEYDRKTAAQYCEDQGTAALGNPMLKK
ncbi:protein kinase [Streptomyces sp. SID13666]|uniref:serine/threonine-protein kinase n=1 Tax=Streptomyces TaxID=1883 RepID=UPI00110674EC|nr:MULTISPECIES: serine/threonine-protein kinase [Streptomyces]NEA57906.1 protein kinase [Streptomyces sp. SID13666]NEA74968.1 protein kinase [Streptomyces sp. SID13588]QNA75520.1 protein kinase [Streptomyces sp. So13.3]